MYIVDNEMHRNHRHKKGFKISTESYYTRNNIQLSNPSSVAYPPCLPVVVVHRWRAALLLLLLLLLLL